MGKLVGLLGTGVGLAVELSKSKAPPPPTHQLHDSSIQDTRPSSLDLSRDVPKSPRPKSAIGDPDRDYRYHSDSGHTRSPLGGTSLRSAIHEQSTRLDVGNRHDDVGAAPQKRNDKTVKRVEDRYYEPNYETDYSSEPPSYQAAIQSKSFTDYSRSSPVRDREDLHQFSGEKDSLRAAGHVSVTAGDREMLPGSDEGLELPVIVPQRRPENKSRGWMLCYAPMLQSCNISQREFLDFLTSFNEASKSSPYLDAVNVAALGVGFVPGIAPLVVSMVVPVAVKYAKTAQTNAQTSSYLRRINKDFFAPHNLFAMVVIYQPESASPVLSVNMSSPLDSVRQYGASRINQLGNGSTGSDTSMANRAVEMPTAAPLIFPSAEELPTQYKNQFQRTCYVAADYFDRRSRASYATEHPEAQAVLGPGQKFRNAWSDPNSSVHSGGLKGLITGGLVQSRERDDNRHRDQRDRERRHHHRRDRSRSDSSGSEDDDHRNGHDHRHRRDNDRGGLLGAAKAKLMKKDLLYLMIVNLPASEQVSY